MAEDKDTLTKYAGYATSAGILLGAIALRGQWMPLVPHVGGDDTLIPLTLNCAASYPVHETHCVFDRAHDALFAKLMAGFDGLSGPHADQASAAVARNMAALGALPAPDRHAMQAMLAYEAAARGPAAGGGMLAHLVAFATDETGKQELPALRFVTQGDNGRQESQPLALYDFLLNGNRMQAPLETMRIEGSDMTLQGRASDGPLLPVWTQEDVAAMQAQALELRQRVVVEKNADGPRRVWAATLPGGAVTAADALRGR